MATSVVYYCCVCKRDLKNQSNYDNPFKGGEHLRQCGLLYSELCAAFIQQQEQVNHLMQENTTLREENARLQLSGTMVDPSPATRTDAPCTSGGSNSVDFDIDSLVRDIIIIIILANVVNI